MSREYDLIEPVSADANQETGILIADKIMSLSGSSADELRPLRSLGNDELSGYLVENFRVRPVDANHQDESHLTYAASDQPSEGAAYELVSSIDDFVNITVSHSVTLLDTLSENAAVKGNSPNQQHDKQPQDQGEGEGAYYDDAVTTISQADGGKFTLHYRASSGEYATAYPESTVPDNDNNPGALTPTKLQPNGSQHYADARSKLFTEPLPIGPSGSDVQLKACREELEQLRSALLEKDSRNSQLEREVYRLRTALDPHASAATYGLSVASLDVDYTDKDASQQPLPIGNNRGSPNVPPKSTGTRYRYATREGEVPVPKTSDDGGNSKFADAARLKTYTEIVTEFLALADHVVDVLGEAKSSFIRRRKLVKKLHDTVSNVRDAVRSRLSREQKSRSLPALNQAA